jgi:hypothetical protein
MYKRKCILLKRYGDAHIDHGVSDHVNNRRQQANGQLRFSRTVGRPSNIGPNLQLSIQVHWR